MLPTHSAYSEFLWWLVVLVLAGMLAVAMMNLPAY
jgi:hypothetical protein